MLKACPVLWVFCFVCAILPPAPAEETAESPEPIESLRAQAEAGDAEAQCRLGERLYHGTGCEKNLEEAVKWLRASAQREDA